ncbi:MAG: hypothetical protein AAGC54_06995 [Cyanobacteria bacterium P01_F01_bin.4]
MAHDMTQWLAEIRTLQRQLVDLRQDRDQAYASAANWRRLYESEAQQRRQEVEQSQLKLQGLIQELETFKGAPAADATSDGAEVTEKVEAIASIEEARSQLLAALKLCNQLSNALRQEKASHEQTRQSLTTALGDTIDLLAKEREVAAEISPGEAEAGKTEAGETLAAASVPGEAISSTIATGPDPDASPV